MKSKPIQSGGEAMPETRDIGDAIDLFVRAINLNELLYMAAESTELSKEMSEAFTTGSDVVDNMLKEVKGILYANIDRKGGAA